MKNLYASAVGKNGKERLIKVIERFGTENFDYLIFVFDDTQFSESIFHQCKFIYEKGEFGYFWKKYLTPERVAPYQYIFPWMDDLDILNLNIERFMQIMVRNKLELAQPALSHDSFIFHEVTRKSLKYKIGRFTHFTEIMAQVFCVKKWIRFWEILEFNPLNPKSWGYDLVTRKACEIKRMAVIDCEEIRHCNSLINSLSQEKRELLCVNGTKDMRAIMQKHKVKWNVCMPQIFYFPLR